MKNKIILGITGGVAAYKGAELARRLINLGLSVQVVMTKSAEKFIAPLTFSALTGQKALGASDVTTQNDPIPHITLTKEASLIVIAPATANIIGKMANGIGDDLLSTMLLASDSPVIVAPAMNTKMLNNTAVQENIAKLKERNIKFIDPAKGELACGEIGEGKLADVGEIVARVTKELSLKRDLSGLNVLVSAGGTREPVDTVRYIGNRSSGKMGSAVAKCATMRGANVTLIAASMEIEDPHDGINVVHVQTASDMLGEVTARLPFSDILLMTAAVGDYTVSGVREGKIKNKDGIELKLTPNKDILKEAAKLKKGNQVIVGFAAECENVVEHGKEKLLAKNMDMIVINDVSRSDIGFGSDYNEVVLVKRDGKTISPPKGLKTEIADTILDHSVALKTSKADEGVA